MKKFTLLILAFCCLLIQGCAKDYSKANTLIYGKMNVISKNGEDITDLCRLSINSKGVFMQEASTGKNKLKDVFCKYGKNFYNFNLGGLYVDIPKEGMAYYFGDITIILNRSNRYRVSIEGNDSSNIYTGHLPKQEIELKSNF